MNELREHVLNIWSKFPVELCKKIVEEFDNKIKICQKEKGKILTKTLYKKYVDGQKIKDVEKGYDWTTLKRDNYFRIVYNNKMIELLIKKAI